ncbi:MULTISPECIES: 4-(cytidine 5'-diphospho)-2-C-methyl-D-erythritol kinase [unclassified Sphingomonas]|uniref:4-(cytidine 5'-diphospho)-2-C-methyl-D-erythritol kinase n=1 Tax=unclassified Sphingomonas TaxID=196159 RepID=UPI0006F73D6B|nr:MULTISPECIES: 4-(cytidine 5'-diphospho)-2-C-methyl-D-erythritol kinase [unclassified Sphingomonas]KQM66714.1 4-diphosphocytidyl-2C-methyl-D-erythritol kinase [Sphingomonas sp. Leaf16]KQN17662.1 4-diphosphocytidyl-2C-methyl-D-erythritol kinase [Sphingomonas sp. Leaf29]KQN23527.1 4-diphosphocytidyl-2C-methyl-D-erythritol kinase [Sphingomonas sp. Leaf32]
MIVEPAPAKLNLALHVRARRDDGYHELETLFVFVRDGDTVRLTPADRDGFAIVGPFAGGLSGEGNNLVTRARDAFRAAFGVSEPLSIVLDKHLPVASGIGGGSADAAATLRGMAKLAGVSRDDPALMAIAAELGSDVPACLAGRTMIGRGRGERLTPIDVPPLPVLLVNPGVGVSTAAVFAAWDRTDRGPLPQGDALTIALAGRNDLEPPARALAPAIDTVLAMLAAADGVRLARMSGSGATCFALFDRAEDRAAAATTIQAACPAWWCLETALA